MKVKFIDSKNYPGWHKSLPLGKESYVEAQGEKIHEDEEYLTIAQAVSGKTYGNILRIPKVAIIPIIVILLLIFWRHDIKGAILALLP